MLRFAFNKLVRDKIPDQQIASGAKPTTRALSPEEHWDELALKAQEEATELSRAQGKEKLEELADLQQVIDDALIVAGYSKAELHEIQAIKAAKVGTFSTGIYVEDIEVSETDPWVGHFKNNPDRYPQID